MAHLHYIRIHPVLLTPHITNTQHYLRPTLRYETAGPSYTNTNTLQCGQLFEQTVQHSSATDITTIAAQTLLRTSTALLSQSAT